MADFNAEFFADGLTPLVEATSSMIVTMPAEDLSLAGGATLTVYYLMIGWDSVTPTAITVWQVTGSPDTTGASSGNPTIDAATIRILKTWSA